MQKFLINYTNHPSNKWSVEQTEDALQQWTGIIDFAFPVIEPEWNREELETTFNNFLEEVKEMMACEGRELESADFLVMGDFRYTYDTVNRLKEMGLLVFSHAGRRNVVETDNKTISQFKFIRFVEYF